ncbi:MAG TPA: DUF2332 family protein [Steroidobacteraceae bacterium]
MSRLGRPPEAGQRADHLRRIRRRKRISAHLSRAGAAARADAPLAWLRFELADPPELRLTLWPSGEETLLARAHPHGAWAHWLA